MKKLLCSLAFTLLASNTAMATVLTEDFEASFPTWESNWLGQNSNLQNVYGIGGDRGNNPDGLWIADGLNNGSNTEITFNTIFGASINSFSIDVTSWITNAIFTAYDMNNAVINTTAITSYYGGYSDPGTYQTISFNTSNGLSKFSIFGSGIEGNTSIDNVVVNTGSVSVPEPTPLILLGLGLIGLGLSRRKNKAQ